MPETRSKTAGQSANDAPAAGSTRSKNKQAVHDQAPLALKKATKKGKTIEGTNADISDTRPARIITRRTKGTESGEPTENQSDQDVVPKRRPAPRPVAHGRTKSKTRAGNEQSGESARSGVHNHSNARLADDIFNIGASRGPVPTNPGRAPPPSPTERPPDPPRAGLARTSSTPTVGGTQSQDLTRETDGEDVSPVADQSQSLPVAGENDVPPPALPSTACSRGPVPGEPPATPPTATHHSKPAGLTALASPQDRGDLPSRLPQRTSTGSPGTLETPHLKSARGAPEPADGEDSEPSDDHEDSDDSDDDFAAGEATYRKERECGFRDPNAYANSSELDEEEDLKLESEAVSDNEGDGPGGRKHSKSTKKVQTQKRNKKKKKKNGGGGNISSAEDSDDPGARKLNPGRLSKAVKDEAVALWEHFMLEAEQLSARSGHSKESILSASGAALKGHRATSAWNTLMSVEAAGNPRPQGMKHGEWLNAHVQPKYEALFKDCDNTPLGQAARRKIMKDLIDKKKELDAETYKSYASTGKKFCVIQKIASELEEQAQYAHNVCNVEVFGVVYEPGYGDINATAANTMFAGSADLAAVLTDKKVASKVLIAEIQSLVGLKLKQDKRSKKVRAKQGPSTRDDWRHEVKTLFHTLLFPDDEEDRKRVPWTKMGAFLFTKERRLLQWPSQVELPNQWFDLNKLNEPQLKLLCKSDIDLEDWTEEEKDRAISDQADIVLISSASGRTLLSLQDVPQWRQQNEKRNKRKASKPKHSLVPLSMPNDHKDDVNARIDDNDRFASPAPSLQPTDMRSPSPTSSVVSRKRPALTGQDDPRKKCRRLDLDLTGMSDAGGHPHDSSHPSSRGLRSVSVAPPVRSQATPAKVVQAEFEGRLQRFMLVDGRMIPIAAGPDSQ